MVYKGLTDEKKKELWEKIRFYYRETMWIILIVCIALFLMIVVWVHL